MAIRVNWRDDGTGGSVHENGDLVGFIRLVNDWYGPGQTEPCAAWVIEWVAEGIDWTQRSLIDLDAAPVLDRERIENLATKAREVIDLGPPPEPMAFGFGKTGLSSNAEQREMIELTSHAVQAAEARLHDAARDGQAYAASLINIAVVEVAAWLRTLDDLLTAVWRGRLTDADREAVSNQVDAAIARPGIQPGLIDDARGARRRTGAPYDDWTIPLLSRGVYLPRGELRGLRWLAGILLHRGPLSTVEMKHWRQGEQPRWRWRAADDVVPPGMRKGERKHDEEDRKAYERLIQGRDVLGSLNLFHVVVEVKFLFTSLLP